MTTTNQLVKREDGQVLYADNLNDNVSFVLSGNIISNLNYLSQHSYYTTPSNFIYDNFISSTYINASSTCSISLNNQLAFSGYVYDDYGDSSFDTNKWTGVASTGVGTASEVAGSNINIALEGYAQYAIAAGVGVAATGYLDSTGALLLLI